MLWSILQIAWQVVPTLNNKWFYNYNLFGKMHHLNVWKPIIYLLLFRQGQGSSVLFFQWQFSNQRYSIIQTRTVLSLCHARAAHMLLNTITMNSNANKIIIFPQRQYSNTNKIQYSDLCNKMMQEPKYITHDVQSQYILLCSGFSKVNSNRLLYFILYSFLLCNKYGQLLADV